MYTHAQETPRKNLGSALQRRYSEHELNFTITSSHIWTPEFAFYKTSHINQQSEKQKQILF
jgi:hypothetical protein